MGASKKVLARITHEVRRYQAVLAEAKNRDVSESDTVAIIRDMLSDVFGYKKISEITTEFAIRSTYVDLAVVVEDVVRFLVEAKAIGIELKDSHVKQAVDYGANKGIEWVILTNGGHWRIYRIHFRQPIDKSLVFDIDLLNTKATDSQLSECFGNLSREGFTESSMNDFYKQRQAISRFTIAALLVSDPILNVLRRELKRLAPGIKVEDEFVRNLVKNEVLKRELVDGEEADGAKKLVRRSQKVSLRRTEQEPDQKPTPITPQN